MAAFQITLDTVVESIESDTEEEEDDDEDDEEDRRFDAKSMERQLLEMGSASAPAPERRSASLTTAEMLAQPGAKPRTTAQHGVRLVEPKKENAATVEVGEQSKMEL